MKEYTIKKGRLWLGMEWKQAIKRTLKNADMRIIEVFKDVNPNKLLCDKKEFSHYSLVAYERRTYKTRIPKRYNAYVKNLLNEQAKFKIVLSGGRILERKNLISQIKIMKLLRVCVLIALNLPKIMFLTTLVVVLLIYIKYWSVRNEI